MKNTCAEMTKRLKFAGKIFPSSYLNLSYDCSQNTNQKEISDVST